MMSADVCTHCHNQKCEIQTPLVAKWQLSASTSLECAYFSCGDGLKAAREARASGPYETVSLADGTLVEAVGFETPEKETLNHFPRRCCTKAGLIIGETTEGFKWTGQTLYTQGT